MAKKNGNVIEGFEIETGIPLPRKEPKGIAKVLRALEPGQSVFFPKESTMSLGSRISYVRMQLKPAKFVSRTVDGGVRVWRQS